MNVLRHNVFRCLLVSVLFLLSISFPQLAAFCQQFIKEMCYVMYVNPVCVSHTPTTSTTLPTMHTFNQGAKGLQRQGGQFRPDRYTHVLFSH